MVLDVWSQSLYENINDLLTPDLISRYLPKEAVWQGGKGVSVIQE